MPLLEDRIWMCKDYLFYPLMFIIYSLKSCFTRTASLYPGGFLQQMFSEWKKTAVGYLPERTERSELASEHRGAFKCN